MQGGSATALHWAINSVKKGGIVSIVGVYGPIDTLVPIGNVVNKGITIRANQASVKRLLPRLIEHVQNGVLDPKALITHRIPLEDVSDAYRIFSAKLDELHQAGADAAVGQNVKREEQSWSISAKDPSQIKGWGVDADPKNDPTYPMKHRNDGEHAGYCLGASSAAAARPSRSCTPTSGRTSPPCSGHLRRPRDRAARSAASLSDTANPSYGHWLPLMLADRVSVVEGVLDDLQAGHVPNVFAERGWKAEWEHNRINLVGRVVVGAVLVSAAVGLFAASRARADSSRRS